MADLFVRAVSGKKGCLAYRFSHTVVRVMPNAPTRIGLIVAALFRWNTFPPKEMPTRKVVVERMHMVPPSQSTEKNLPLRFVSSALYFTVSGITRRPIPQNRMLI